jgi:hypothetical protein
MKREVDLAKIGSEGGGFNGGGGKGTGGSGDRGRDWEGDF